MVESTDPYCLRDGEAEALLAEHPWRRFVVLGDSVAEGITEPVDGYHPLPMADRVAECLNRTRPGLAYLNLGERNLRAHQIRARQLPTALDFCPDLALVIAGANDALRPGYESRAEAVDRELATMVSALRDRGALVVFLSVFVLGDYPALPPWLGPAFARRLTLLAQRARPLARAQGVLHIDLAAHPAADVSLACADGLHGNGRAQAIATAELIRGLGAYLPATSDARCGPGHP